MAFDDSDFAANLFQKKSLIQRRCGGLHQHIFQVTRLLSSRKQPKGSPSFSAVYLFNDSKSVCTQTVNLKGSVKNIIAYFSMYCWTVYNFFTQWVCKPCISQLCSNEQLCYYCCSDGNIKEESRGREWQDSNNGKDQRRKRWKRGESYWWSRFQVWIIARIVAITASSSVTK